MNALLLPKIFAILLLSLAIMLALVQAGTMIAEHFYRWMTYHKAKAFARSLEKPFLIIGRPMRPWVHGCGDVTLDRDSRVALDCPNGVIADVLYLPFRDQSFGAVFCSHVLEELDSPEAFDQALREMNRVGKQVFIANTILTNWWWRYVSPKNKLVLKRRGGDLVADYKRRLF